MEPTDSHGQVPSSRNSAAAQPVAPGVAYLTVAFVNAYFVGEPGGPWTLVDTGLPKTAPWLRRVARERFGDAPPQAIVLTHGHFDHAGNALELAREWDVPVYAHPLELPYLTGRSDYAPQDPTIGGAIAMLSRAFPHSGRDLGRFIHPLPEDGSVPGVPGWRWLHTPGHTAGHTSLWREGDRTLVAGDALTTMDLDSWLAILAEQRSLDRPPAPLTPNWRAARQSVETLAALGPETIGAGHGIPISGSDVPRAVAEFARRFDPPAHGRYVPQPAEADERGIVSVPPPVADPIARRMAAAAGLAAVAWLATRAATATRRRPGARGPSPRRATTRKP